MLRRRCANLAHSTHAARAALNGVDLYYEDTGDGFPVVFCHEFAGDYRAWDPQVRAFGRLYRCVTYSQRGFPPSSVPDDLEAYTQDALIEDLRALLTHLAIEQAHVVGFSMGGSVVLNFALRYPELCRSIAVVGTGAGATNRPRFEQDIDQVVDLIRTQGMRAFADRYAEGPTRLPFKRKDPLRLARLSRSAGRTLAGWPGAVDARRDASSANGPVT